MHDETISAAKAAKRLKNELETRYEGTKFLVEVDAFDGGDTLAVSWTGGPTVSQIRRIAGKYEKPHAKAPSDLYFTRDSVFTARHGGAKYVTLDRHG